MACVTELYGFMDAADATLALKLLGEGAGEGEEEGAAAAAEAGDAAGVCARDGARSACRQHPRHTLIRIIHSGTKTDPAAPSDPKRQPRQTPTRPPRAPSLSAARCTT
jgi:hypothetical protein